MHLDGFQLRSVQVRADDNDSWMPLRYYRVSLKPRLALTSTQGTSQLELIDDETGDHEAAELNDDGDVEALVTTKSDGSVQRREYALSPFAGRYLLFEYQEYKDGVCVSSLLFDEGKLDKDISFGIERSKEAKSKDHAYASKLFGLTVTYAFD
jgi:hypothetical protein